MDSNSVDAATAPRGRRPLRRGVKVVVWCVYIALLVEVTCRCYWIVGYGVPATKMNEIFAGRFYPELRNSGVLDATITRSDEHFDVLMLGGSVLTNDFGTIEKRLRDETARLTGRPVRVFNAAGVGMTSRDSLLKYHALEGREFDLVVVYHAINDARMNNCPREQFRDDYTHCSWYARVEGLGGHRELNWWVTPYTIKYVGIGALDHRFFGRYLPRNPPPDGRWFDDGLDLKTPPAFESNIRQILELAKARGAEVLLPTFALHLSADYASKDKATLEKEYRMWHGQVQLWGNPEGVYKAVHAHNDVLRRLAGEYSHVSSVELQDRIPYTPVHFYDCCHLTDGGCAIWVENVRPAIAGLIAKRYGTETVVAETTKATTVK